MNKPYVAAMRIYLKDGYKPMADLAILVNGMFERLETIRYDDVNEREKYYINAYTLIWDERTTSMTFADYLSWRHYDYKAEV
jgi:hypothetical protein